MTSWPMRTINPIPADERHYFYVGVDLAQTGDYTVLCFVEQYKRYQDSVVCYDVRQVVRLARKQAFAAQCQQIAALVDSPILGKDVSVIYDRTGIGAAVAEMLHAAVRRSTSGIVITGGQKVGYLDGYSTVPKRDLVAVAQILIGGERLQVADSPSCRGLLHELEIMQVTVNPQTGYESFAAPAGEHDDRALAAMLALWYAEEYSSHWGGKDIW